MFKTTFFGVRGSIPSPGAHTIKYGGNTSCHFIEVGDEKFILDAGSGIKPLGDFILKNFKPPFKYHLFISHTHWDHIQGMPFFTPIFFPGTKIHLFGPVNYADSLENIIGGQMTYVYFPVNFSELKAEFSFKDLTESQFEISDIHIRTKNLNHPILTLGYRFTYKGKVLVSCYDTEPFYNMFSPEDEDTYAEAEQTVREMNEKLLEFIADADFVIYDSQYTKDDYKKGWGHSTLDTAISNCLAAGVKKMAIFHHDPSRTDTQLEVMLDYARSLVEKAGSKMEVILAQEGLTVSLEGDGA
ncbi:MAG: MBL fold metallo-hydrolase [Candidatus Wallbacteria bacterium]|nr:MBL fold metallo-hydrolase [Candidatus Wallbacteria bacterium]